MAIDLETADNKKTNALSRLSALSIALALLMTVALAVVAFRYATDDGLAMTGDPEQRTAGEKRCEFFVLQKILSARNPVVLDHWDIDDKRVFRVGFNASGGESRSERLCVYDIESRRALLPAIADQEQWLPSQPDASNG